MGEPNVGESRRYLLVTEIHPFGTEEQPITKSLFSRMVVTPPKGFHKRL